MEFVLHCAELVGTIAFALSGALLAIEKRLDLFGILLLSIVTALGGGTIRDLLLGITPPKMFYSYEYLALAAVTALITFLAARSSRRYFSRFQGPMDFLFVFSDALGLGIFAVIGTEAGLAAGYGDNPFLCVFLGMTTGVGGGILRDIMCGDIPFVLRKHIYAVAVIAGGLVFYLLIHLGLDGTLAALAGVVVTVALRLLAWHYRWNLPRVQVPEEEKTI